MRLAELRAVASEQVTEVEELVQLLELTIEDVLERFGDRLLENKHKFGVYDPDE